MNNESIDFSIGFASSLELLNTYRQDGMLYADIQRIPGIRGRCRAWIQLAQGKVVSCFLEESDGQKHLIDTHTLSRLDAEKGPFAWTLLSFPAPAPSVEPSSSPLLVSPLPKRIASLDLHAMQTWSSKEKMLLRTVFAMIDGRRSVEELKASLSLSPDTVEKVLQTLLTMHVITMDEHTT